MYAPALVFIGAWGLLLAALNMFSMAHPTQHVSWGGLLTFEATNEAFGSAKDGFHFEPLGDTIFILVCAAMVAFGSKTIGERGSLVDWLKGLVVNDTWPALNDLSVGGGQRTFAAWCFSLGPGFLLLVRHSACGLDRCGSLLGHHRFDGFRVCAQPCEPSPSR